MIKELTDEFIEPVFTLMKANMEPYYIARNEPWNEEPIRKHFLDQHGIVLEQDGRLKGFSFYQLIGERLHIHTLHIPPELQNRNIGGRFLIWYRQKANILGLKYISCGVFASNQARDMYRRIGFEEVGEDNGVIQMSLPVTES
ncbi:hypothetical protein CHH28_02700 [Bacterioplanes sanyensis]|uniref:N-acetyltransferase domain-containing protein n=1 Tax=Bacterioplanes sanyensis TaxID=1249553 RepID=A0A222FGD2_9GAMM|nr:GNAT family N-acetyltransferase [Bacterioplanes sanyensis]ASP37646.1 hypothetical protein CHH28_02700 [Bacterioplanes sanyensis]